MDAIFIFEEWKL